MLMNQKFIIAIYAQQQNHLSKEFFFQLWDFADFLSKIFESEFNIISCQYIKKSLTGLSNHPYKLSKNNKRKIIFEITQGNVSVVGLTAMINNPHGALASAWDFVTYIGMKRNNIPVILFGIDLQILNNKGFLLENIIHDIMSYCIKITSIKYGYCAIMPDNFLPGCYALGIGSSEMPEYLIREANAWSLSGINQSAEIVRNVYGLQLLNENHLLIKVGNQQLDDWIKSSANRGRLIKFNEDLWLWTFKKNDADIDYIQWDNPSVINVMHELMSHQFFLWQTLWNKDCHKLG